MTTYTIFSEAIDGFVQSSSTSYTTAAAGNGTESTSSTSGFFGQRLQATTYRVLQNFNRFDCSVIDAGETVSAALLNQYVLSDDSDADFTAEARDIAIGATLSIADFIPAVNLDGVTLRATLATSGITVDAYNTFTDVAMVALVDAKAAETELNISSARQRTGDAPTGLERVSVTVSEATGTDTDPYLDVTAAGGGGAFSLEAAGGSYAVSGTAAALSLGKFLDAAGGSYAISGTAATPSLGKVLAADAGSYAVNGSAASLLQARALAAAGDSYAIGGTDAGLNLGFNILAEGGSYSVDGAAAALSLGKFLAAAGGSYAVSGAEAAALLGRAIAAAGGSYAVNGSDATLTLSSLLSLLAEGGAYAVSGADAALLRELVAAAEGGAYAVSGTAATLTLTAAGGAGTRRQRQLPAFTRRRRRCR